MNNIVGIFGAAVVVGAGMLWALINTYKRHSAVVAYTLYDKSGVLSKPRSINDKAEVDISLVVPAYNEFLRLPSMLHVTLDYLNKLRIEKGLSYEIIVVDDGSKDDTCQLVKKEQQKTDSLYLMKLAHNVGKGGAVRMGVSISRGKYVLMVDADAATDINDLDKLLSRIKTVEVEHDRHNLGVAIGSRAHLEKLSVATRELHRTILMHGFHALVCILCSNKIQDTQCGFKLFTRKAAGILFPNLHLDRWAFDVELIYMAEQLSIPMVEVGVNWHEVDGSKLITSKWDIVTTSINMAKDMLTVRLCYVLGIWKLPVK